MPGEELREGDFLLRSVRIFRELVRIALLLVIDLADGRPLRICAADFVIELLQLRPYAEDLKEGIRLLLGVGLHEAGKIEREYADELI